MDSKRRVSVWVSIATAAATSGILIVTGCTLDKNGTRPGNVFTRIGGHSDQLAEPKRCLLKVAILSRPFDDPVINEVVWRVTDEQIIAPALRRAWEANGLRVGRIIGEMPGELEAILRDTAPNKKVNPATFLLENGNPTLIRVSEPVELASLLLNRDNRIFGKDFRDAGGFFRVTAQHDGVTGVSLRLVPEIQHGPIQRRFQAKPNAAVLAPQEFSINSGQQEETIRELAATLVLEPGQVAVVGCRPEHKRSLGRFMFTQAEAHSAERVEKLVLIWASRNQQGQGPNDGTANTTDRPKLFQKLIGPAPSPAAAKSSAPEPDIPLTDTLAPGGASKNAGATPSALPSTSKSKSTAPAAPADPKSSSAPNSPETSRESDPTP
jgi:hypothetical protein